MRRLLAALFVGLLMLPQAISAQTIAPGERVRITHPGEGARIGTAVALTADTLHVQWAGGSSISHIPLEQVSRLEVSRGIQRRSRLTQTGMGFLVGAGIGVALGAAAGSDCPSNALVCPGPAAGALAGGVVIGAAGAVVGTLLPQGRSEKWERVSLRQSRLAILAPSRGSGRVGLAIAF